MTGLNHNWKKYTIGSLINETCLKYLLGNFDDFMNTESSLQYCGGLMGTVVIQILKCHYKMAGEWIECSWAASKNKYRRVPESANKEKNIFKNCLVNACQSMNNATGLCIFAKGTAIHLLLPCLAQTAAIIRHI
jgi:hypothetical protein